MSILFWKRPAAILATLLLTLTATSAFAGDDVEKDDNERVCFYASAVNKFEPIDDYHLMVTAHGSKKYLLTMSHQCFDLMTTPQIKFGVRGDLICNYTRSRISTGRDMCTISTITKVDSFSEAKKLAEEDQERWKENRHKQSGEKNSSED